jgi:hypothetical protein
MFSPNAVALLNYQIPSLGKVKLSGDDFGLAVSSGPVIRLGTQAGTSSFGYFVGLGLHLYHRFYLTPGLHVGQFADYPPGFSYSGQAVPAGLGTLVPVTRYTTRFALGVTYKAKDFSGLGLTPSTASKPSGNTPPPPSPQPKMPAQTASGGGKTAQK